MGIRSLSLMFAATLVSHVIGGDGGGEITKWMTTTCWSTEKQEKSVTLYSTVLDTKWATVTDTSTVYVPTTYYSTVTTKQTAYITITDTEVQPVTTKQTAYITVTDTEVQPVPTTAVVYNTLTSKETSIQVSRVTSTETAISVVVTTVYEPVTVTTCPTTASPVLEGIVVCPSRIANPIPKTFPPDYTWGCPPGQVCKPKQINCNFEQNLPEDGFYCEPDECIDAPFLPPWDNYERPWKNYSCDNLLEFVPGYFYFDPHLFGTDFSIYDFGGQVAKPCETPIPPPPPEVPPPPPPEAHPPPPPEAHPPPPPSPIYKSTEWQAWSPLAETSTPLSPPKDTEWQNWESSPPLPASQSWGDWTVTSVAWAHVTPRAVLAKRDSIVPIICMDPCQQCGLKAQRQGKVRREICPSDSPFSKAFQACQSCIVDEKKDEPKSIPPLLQSLKQWLDFCASEPATTIVFPPQTPIPEVTVTASTLPTVSITVSTLPAVSTAPSTLPALPEVSTATSTFPAASTLPAVSTPPADSTLPAAPPLSGSVTLITSCNCVTVTSTVSGEPAPITQISDGQAQAPTGPATFPGVASSVRPAELNWLLSLFLTMLALFQT